MPRPVSYRVLCRVRSMGRGETRSPAGYQPPLAAQEAGLSVSSRHAAASAVLRGRFGERTAELNEWPEKVDTT
jgi:hypothetical protein